MSVRARLKGEIRKATCKFVRRSLVVSAVVKRKSPQQREQPGRAAKSEKPVVIGARVRELYEAKGWTQQELAWRANLSIVKVSRVILEQQGIGAGGLLRLALTLATSTDYLLGLTDDKRPRP